MPEERFEERTEPATPRRREEAREEGQVGQSRDLNSAVILLAAVLVLYFTGGTVIGSLMGGIQHALGELAEREASLQDAFGLFSWAGGILLQGLLPFIVVVFVAAVFISFFQVGVHFTLKPLKPNVNKFNVFEGIKRLVSLRGLVRLLFGLLKLSVVGAVVFLTVWAEREELLILMARDFPSVAAYFGELIFVVSIRAAIALLVLAILDYGYQKWQHEKDIRMSRQEVKEELKRYEGDPKIRERRRAIQRQLAMQRMMAKVPKATVVVTNPTELSVALEYESGRMSSPKVLAKGAGHIALRIREIAMEKDIPIVQRPEVARALYRTCEVGQTIPYELYQAVAEILALVYRLKGKTVAA
ncbi:MAG: flagellar biosynthesis protein FlhB [Planctomycetota bacterium]|jgi:flagellar biosynthetic protein FlhB